MLRPWHFELSAGYGNIVCNWFVCVMYEAKIKGNMENSLHLYNKVWYCAFILLMMVSLQNCSAIRMVTAENDPRYAADKQEVLTILPEGVKKRLGQWYSNHTAGHQLCGPHLAFSPDYTKVLYTTASEPNVNVVTRYFISTTGTIYENNRSIDTYNVQWGPRLCFSKDGKQHLISVTKKGNGLESYLIVNNKKQKTYPGRKLLLDQNENGDYVYAISTGSRTAIVWNGMLFKELSAPVRKIRLSQNGKRITYSPLTRFKREALAEQIITESIDGTVRTIHASKEGIYDFKVDLQHEHVMYIEKDYSNPANFVFMDGKLLNEDVGNHSPSFYGFTPGTGLPQYVIKIQDGAGISVDGKIRNPKKSTLNSLVVGDSIGPSFKYTAELLTFNKTGDRFAYTVTDASNQRYIVEQDIKGAVKISEPYKAGIPFPRYIGNKNTLTIVEGKPGQQRLHIGQWHSRIYQTIGTPITNSDNKDTAFIASDERGVFVVLNGKELPAHDSVWLPVFDKSNSNIIYAARDGAKISRFVVPIP